MKKNICSMLSVFATAALLVTGCGGAKVVDEAPAETQAPVTEEAPAEESVEPAAEEPAQETEAEEAEEVQAPAYATYEDPNGWSLQYDENCFEVNQKDNVATFVYTAESGGTNMMTVTYDISSTDPEVIADKLVAEWGDKAQKSEGTFPTDESVPVFRASLPVEEGGSGLYMEAIIRSYMQGCLVFELTGHNSGDDAIDMAASDNLSMLIDSVKFHDYSKEAKASLPAYEYPGPELFYSVVYKYLIDTYAGSYPEAEVGIPCVSIVKLDESDKDDIKVYGDFDYYNYNLSADILENVAGGCHPGVIHVKSTDEGYEVTGMDVVEDGAGFEESAKKIFGDEYDAFMKVYSDSDAKEKTRAQIIANYVAANNLEIKAYQDFGWEPVTLPEENIDSFYSELN